MAQVFLFYVEQSSDYAEDADVSKLHGSAHLHPVKCPDMASLNIKISFFFLQTLLHAHALTRLESMPSEPIFISPAPGKHFEKAVHVK